MGKKKREKWGGEEVDKEGDFRRKKKEKEKKKKSI